jgi:hypothetical protein
MIAIFPAAIAMMAAFVIAQNVEQPRRWIILGLMFFAVCVVLLLSTL